MQLRRHFLIITAAVILSAGSYIIFNRTAESNRVKSSDATPVVTGISELMESVGMRFLEGGPPAPDFNLESLDGEKVELNNLKGNVVLLSFWATW